MSKKKGSSNSHRPLTRQEVAAVWTRLMRGDLRTNEERGLVKRLAGGSEIAVPFLLERLRHGTPAEQDVAIYLLPMIGGRAVKESLLEITRDVEATDRVRAMAMTTLDQLGEKVDYESLFNQLRDPEKFPQQVMDEVLSRASTDESALEVFVRDIERMPAANRLEMIRSFGHLGDPRMLRLLLPLLYARENRTIMAAIDALETMGNPEAVKALTELSQVSSESQVRGRARAVYGKLALAAIAPENQAQKRWHLPAQELPLFKVMVCTIDGDGAQSIIVGRKRPNGRFKAVCILFNDHQGIKDCFGQDMLTKGEWNSIIRSMEEEGMSWVDIGLPQCRRLVAQARAINTRVRRKLPVELEIWGTLLQDGPEAARLWRDDEEEMSISNERRTEPELLRRSDELLKLPEFRGWGFDPGDIELSALIAFEAIRRSHASMPKKASSLNLVIADTLKVLAKPGWCRLVESRLRRQAWLLNKLGRTEHSRLALAVATALGKESDIPLEKQPFLRGMVVKSLFEMSSALKDYTESLPGLVGDRLVANEEESS